MPTKRKKKGVPHRVVNKRNIPAIAQEPDGTIVLDREGKPIRIPIVTIHDVHYYTDDIITDIDESAQCLIDRGFLVPVDGGATEVENNG